MKKIFKALKFTGFLVFVAAVIVACDQDFNSIESDVIGQKSFNIDHSQFPVVSYNKKLDSVKTNNLSSSLLGVFNDPVYGQTTASIITQITPTTFDPDFGDNPAIDSVVLTIPYFNRITGTDTEGNSTYTIQDSLYGDSPIKLTVYKNNYFLRNFNPNEDLNVTQNYYSSTSNTSNNTDNYAITEEGAINFDNYKSTDTIFYDADFLPNSDALILKKTASDGTETTERIAPALRVKLDPDFWTAAILDKEGSSELSNASNFYNYFRGLFFKAEAISNNGNMILLNLEGSGSNITIYYSYDSTASDAERLQQTYAFNFTGVKLNTFINSFSTPLENGDTTNGDEKLYLKGNGSMAVVDLFKGLVDCDGDGIAETNALDCFKKTYRSVDKNGDYIVENGSFVLKKLINEAQLIVYEDETMTAPEDFHKYDRVYAYDIKNNIPLIDYSLDPSVNTSDPYNSRIIHLGQRATDDNGLTKYKIRITEHLNNILLRDSTNTKIGLVLSGNINYTANSTILNSSDGVTAVPSASVITPRGTVLYGSNANVPENKRMALEIYFTENKEN